MSTDEISELILNKLRDLKKANSRENTFEFITMMIEMSNHCVNTLSKASMRELIKFKYETLKHQGLTHDEITDELYDTKFDIEKLSSLYSEGLSSALNRLKESENLSSSTKSDFGLKKNSYIKSELFPMFNFTTERQMGELEKLGLKKSPDTKNPNAIKPRVQYFKEDIINFLNAHAKHAKEFDATRKVANKKKRIKCNS